MIIVRIWEGIGNQMFQYAYARERLAQNMPVCLDMDKAYAERFPTLRNNSPRKNSIHNFNLAIPCVDVEESGKYFFLRNGSWIEKGVCYLSERRLWPYSFIEEKSELYSKKIARVRGNAYIKGWFQDIRYFQDVRKELMCEFTPKKKIKVPNRLLNMIKTGNSVAIHVRRGDYVRLGRALPAAYYIQAKRKLEEYIENPIYLVFSDDYQWVKRTIEWGCRALYIDELCELEDYEQIFVMSRCHSQVISNSTFSWWAAWLNPNPGKVVIMPKKFIHSNPGLGIEGSILV